jgi:hypothetical protein
MNFTTFKLELHAFILVILLNLFFVAHPRQRPPWNQSSVRPDPPDVPSFERSSTLRVMVDLGFLGEGKVMLHAANIVPQIGKARSGSGIDAVSYQITRGLQRRTGNNSPGS